MLQRLLPHNVTQWTYCFITYPTRDTLLSVNTFYVAHLLVMHCLHPVFENTFFLQSSKKRVLKTRFCVFLNDMSQNVENVIKLSE